MSFIKLLSYLFTRFIRLFEIPCVSFSFVTEQIIFQLQEALSQKDVELNELGEKYKKYTEKAKTVMKSLDPRPLSSIELNEIRNKLTESERLLEERDVSFTDFDFLGL